MKIIYDDGSDRTNEENIQVSHHSFEDVSSDSVRAPGARKPVKPVRRPAPTLRPTPKKPEANEIQPGFPVFPPQPQVYAPLPYIQGGAQPTMPLQGYTVQPYPLTPEQMAALAQQYPQGYPVYAVPQQGYIQPQYVQYQPQVTPIAGQQTQPSQERHQEASGMKVLYQSPDFDRPEREADTVSPSYTEPLQTGMVQEDVDFSEVTLPSKGNGNKASKNLKTRYSATGKHFKEDDVEMSVFELNSMAVKSQPTVKPVRQPTIKKQGLDEEEIEQYYEDEEDTPDETENSGKVKKSISVSEIIRRIVLTISVIAIIIAAGMLVNEYRLSKENKKVMEEVSNLIIEEPTTEETTTAVTTTKKNEKETTTKKPEPTTTAAPTPAQQWEQIKAENPDVIFPANLQLKYAKLYATNQDFVGYLSADGVGLNLPVVQAEDDEEYLEKNFYGRSTKYGCPFVTHLNNIVELDTNTIIFGHHMNDGTVFGALDEYKDIEGFMEAPVITFNTLYQDYKWKIIAAFITNAYEKDDNGYVFRYYFTGLSTEERYSAFLNELSQRSLYDTGVDVLPTDKILTLSTCSHEFDDARFVVVARLVRNGESPEVDVSMATENPSPRYPQAYYDAKGKENPYAEANRWEVG